MPAACMLLQPCPAPDNAGAHNSTVSSDLMYDHAGTAYTAMFLLGQSGQPPDLSGLKAS